MFIRFDKKLSDFIEDTAKKLSVPENEVIIDAMKIYYILSLTRDSDARSRLAIVNPANDALEMPIETLFDRPTPRVIEFSNEKAKTPPPEQGAF